MRRYGILLFIVGSAIPDCATIPKAEEPRALAPGEYRLSLAATEGSRAGNAIEGVTTLRVASASDFSPCTNARAKDYEQPLLYGWTPTDFAGVGAPLCIDRPHPSANSQDPVHPGLLVIKVPYGPGSPFTGKKEVSAILVATLSNLRTGELWVDGCGFAMYVLRWDGHCHAGEWKEWGLRKDGRGTFRLCLK
jgi:hypothetical protein